MLFLPTETSKRLRGAMRGGFLSSFSVPGAGIETNFEVYPAASQLVNPAVGVALTPSHVRPASNCWSGVRPLKSTPGWPFGRVMEAPPFTGLQRLFGSVTL